MLSLLLRPLRFLMQAFTAVDSPRQLALGVALGMVVGLVPKGNLTAMVLMFLLFVTRVNLTTGLAAAFLFSWAGTLLDPITHRIGLALLTLEALQGAWTRLFDLPLLAWSGLNNTVVLGSLTVGIVAFYPVYRITLPVIAYYRPRFVNHIQKYRLAHVLRGSELASSWRVG